MSAQQVRTIVVFAISGALLSAAPAAVAVSTDVLITSSPASLAEFHGVPVSAVIGASAPSAAPVWELRGYRAPARGIPGIY